MYFGLNFLQNDVVPFKILKVGGAMYERVDNIKIFNFFYDFGEHRIERKVITDFETTSVNKI